MDEITVRLVKKKEFPAIYEIEKECFSDPWSPGSFDSMNDNPLFVMTGVYENGILCGFLCFFHIYDEIEILNLAVTPDKRRRGYARLMLEKMLDFAARQNAGKVFLEARESNAAARRLYESLGFVMTGIRKKYYDRPVENAVVYRKELKNADTRN